MLVQDAALGDWHATQVEDRLPVDDPHEPIGGQVVRSLLRDDDEVSVMNAVAVDQVADAFERKPVAHPAAESLGDVHDALRDEIRDVGEMVDVLVRDDETLARRGGLQRHERRNQLVPIDEAGWRAASDDLAEDAAHEVLRERDLFQAGSSAEAASTDPSRDRRTPRKLVPTRPPPGTQRGSPRGASMASGPTLAGQLRERQRWRRPREQEYDAEMSAYERSPVFEA